MVMYTTSKAALNKPDFDIDNQQENAFADFYRRMPKRIPGTIRLFDRRDYFSAHGEDALYIADNVYHTKTVLKYFKSRSVSSSSAGGEGLPSCTLSKSVAINFLREAITSKQLRIEIWNQPARGGSSSSSSSSWELGRQASPGNFEDVEDLLFDASSQNITESPMCLSIVFRIKDSIKSVGIAYVDSVERRLGVTEFVETDIFSNTESLLIQLGVKEVIIPSEDKSADIDAAKLRKLIERCGVVFTERKRSDFAVKNVDQDLNGLLKGNLEVTNLPVFDQKLAMSACNALISYLDLLGSDIHRSAYELHSHDLSQYMKLDASAVRALTLMPDPTLPGAAGAAATAPGMHSGGSAITGKAGKDSSASLFGLLNKCKTGQGTRLLAMWLKQPLVNLHQIENRQELVEIFTEKSSLRSIIRDEYLKTMPDFQRLSKKFLAGRATLEDVVRVYQAVTKLPDILDQLVQVGRERRGEEYLVEDENMAALMDEAYCNSLGACINNTEKLAELVETTIDFDSRDHQITIKPDFDTALQEIAAKLEKIKKSLNRQFEETADDLGFDTSNPKKCPLNFENHQVYGHCFRLTRKEASAIKGKKGYIELANRQNGCYFTTKDLKRLNEDYADLSATYERKQSTLAKEVINIAGSYAPSLEDINGVIAHLDVITSFAHVANNAPIPYVKPTMLERGSGDLILKESRHPCLETLPDINFIANDVEMKKDDSEFQIITGANTGGKSVYLRQIGCIALMAQVGSFVPAEEAQLPIFDCILARVGAGDSQLKGISTFMAEMLETATILKSATANSLIIIDELGRGTSTYDGFGLAWAISEHIAQKIRCFALFATHFHDLTTLTEEIPHVKNMHVMAHVEAKSDSITGRDIVMLYKVKPGISDQSFGIHVAELAKFPDEVVRLAKRKADELEETTDENLPDGATVKHSQYTVEEIAEGTKLVSEMLEAWNARKFEDLRVMPSGTEDSAMDVDGEAGDNSPDLEQKEARIKAEMTLLRQCFEEFKPRLAQSPWAMTALLDTY